MSRRILLLIITTPVIFFYITTNSSENTNTTNVDIPTREQLDLSRCSWDNFSVKHNPKKKCINFYFCLQQPTRSIHYKVGSLNYTSTSIDPLIIKNKTITDATWNEFVKNALTLLKKTSISAVRWKFTLPMSIIFTDRFGFKIKSIDDNIVTAELDLESSDPAKHLSDYYKHCSIIKKRGCKTFRIQDNGTTLTVYHMPKISVDDLKEKKPYCIASLHYDYAILKNLRIHKNHRTERWEEYLIIKAMKKLRQRDHNVVGYHCHSASIIKSVCDKFGFLPSPTQEHPFFLTFDFRTQNDPNDHLVNFYQALNINKKSSYTSNVGKKNE